MPQASSDSIDSCISKKALPPSIDANNFANPNPPAVTAHRGSKNVVAFLRLCPAIHVLLSSPVPAHRTVMLRYGGLGGIHVSKWFWP